MSKVYLVGAGPGDPKLLTVRAHELITQCAVLAHDELVSPAILGLAPAHAERIPVGRRGYGVRHHDSTIHPLVIARAAAGLDVVRLKGGDPMVFGRGGEEVQALRDAGIDVEVVPGITAALGAAAALAFPLTHRDAAHSVTFSAGRKAARARPAESTLVFYMALAELESICDDLTRDGRSSSTPALVVSSATLPTQRHVAGTLADVAALARDAALESPALLFVGDVVTLGLERLDELGEARTHRETLRLPAAPEIPGDLHIPLLG
jgi:uroporphyrin-III C-methyltransferase